MLPKVISAEVNIDLIDLINEMLPVWQTELDQYDLDYMDLTVAINDDGTEWNYQTGDNSYTGGAYGLPHWAVTSIGEDTKPTDLLDDIVNQLEDLINQ